MTIQNADKIFDDMQAQVGQPLPYEEQGYVQYWEDRANNEPGNEQVERISKIVSGLTKVAIRGISGDAEYTDREPQLQARYWYRSLGPLNPMRDVEADLITAASLMYNKDAPGEKENANLKLDSAFALTDLALVSKEDGNVVRSLGLATDVIDDVMGSAEFSEKEAAYRLKAAILKHDLNHLKMRHKYSGTLDPKHMETGRYREFEKAFVMEELRTIDEFAKQLQSGITDENFGILFEGFHIMDRRFNAWQNEELDVLSVRGATSREDAEWTGEDVLAPGRVSGNHDIVVKKADKSGKVSTYKIQLKTVRGNTTYHPSVTVITYEDLTKDRFRTIDGATNRLDSRMNSIKLEYLRTLYPERYP